MSKIVYIEKTDVAATLCTWIYCSFAQMWSAEQLGYQGYINWPHGYTPPRCLQAYEDEQKFSKEPNMFLWFFEQPKIHWIPPRENVWTWEDWVDPSPIPLMAQPLYIIKNYYKRNLHFNLNTDERGEMLVDKYNIDFDKTIGLTWRGTDIFLDGRPYIPIEVYYPFIDEILEKEPDLRIMCTAEEQEILDPLLKRYPRAFVIEEFISSPRGSKHNPERLSNVSGYERGLQPALMVWLFSKCKYYIKNRSSTGAVASWLSDGTIINLAHEETLSYVKMDDQVEIEGIKYPLIK